ncbi:hypothetical protein NMG60_11015528 [Bertholletia excelsa]
MRSTYGKRLLSSTVAKVEEETKANFDKQGIVSVLSSDRTNAKAASLRRTLSVNMSSDKWLAQSGFFPFIKKTASCQELSISSSSPSDFSSSEGEEEFDGNKMEQEVAGRPEQFYTWRSILTEKTKEEPSKLAPYVHPLVKRSTNSLSKQSLKICTESLGSETGSDGSETGSDGFSSYTPSEIGEPVVEEEEEEKQPLAEKHLQYSFEDEDWLVVRQSYSNGKRSSSPLPPPLSCLARPGGPSIRMQSHRIDGRLVLQARSFTSHNYFRAQRQDGRLLLTLANRTPTGGECNNQEDHVEELEENIFFQHFEEDREEDNDYRNSEDRTRATNVQIFSSTRATNVGRTAIMTRKLTEKEEAVETIVLAGSVPQTGGPMSSPPAATVAAASLNPMIARRCSLPTVVKNSNEARSPCSPKPIDQQQRDGEMQLLHGCCKQPWRSLFTWQTNCVATS